MDSINVMTSLVGLLGSAGKVVALLLVVKKSISEAPRLMDQMLAQVQEVAISLSAVQSFLLDIGSAPRGRTSMIRVEQLVAILTEAVLTFSELEALVTAIVKDKGRLPVISRLMSLWKEEVVSSIMVRLERHKSSLSLMMNIAQCGSDLEAERSREALQSLVEQLLRSNYEISMRLQSIEENFETRSVITCCFRNGTMPDIPDDEPRIEQVTDSKSIAAEACPEGSALGTQEYIGHQPGFQVDLGTSRVYRRTESYESDVSFTSSAIRTHAWSIFSGLSLSQVSVVSAIALPLCLDEIYNQEGYGLRRSDHNVLEQTSQKMEKESLIDPLAECSSKITADISLGPTQYGAKSKSQNDQEGVPASSLKHSQSSSQVPTRTGKMVTYKLIVMGDERVGIRELTTQLNLRYLEEPHDPMVATWENYYQKIAVIDGVVCIIEVSLLLDQQLKEYTAFQDQYLRDGEGFVLVYSVTSRSSFTQIEEFHSQIRRVKDSSPTTPTMLVGHNMEQETEGEVTTREGQELAAKLGCDVVEVSSKNDINVAKAFYDVVRSLRRQRMLAAIRAPKRPLGRRNSGLVITLSDIVKRRNRSRRP